jgi:hydrogenase/urease accessory protein HupE
LILACAPVLAHESRPAYLEIKQTAPNRYDVLWRTPVMSGMRLPVVLKFPDEVSNVREPIVLELPDSLVERRIIEAGGTGLAGKRIEFVGLIVTITDVLVRIQLRDGSYSTVLVHPSQPWIEIAAPKGRWQVALTYLTHGINHILRGIDHLLFILGLLLIVKDRWMLLKTITAFTVAHSITLAIATLGYASAPLAPLNAAIAMSILFIGVEVIRMQRGETSLTIQHPWVVAFAFGLLHGFGFASGLVALGLPRGDVPMALLLFNVGVEIGQLFFVLIILLLERSFRTLQIRWPHWVEELPAYTVGGLGAFWAIQRTVILIAGLR